MMQDDGLGIGGNPATQSANDPAVTTLHKLEQEQLGDVCRDFLRNVCRRGSVCRYRHPDPSEAEELGKKIEYVFCHDYQNRECRRQNCRFLHCTKQEEEVYKQSGKMPTHVLEKLANSKNGIEQHNDQNGGGGGGMGGHNSVPICKDFLKGECRRGQGRCKFRHISQNETEMDMRGGGGGHGIGPHAPHGLGMHTINGSNQHPIGHGPMGGLQSSHLATLQQYGLGGAGQRGSYVPQPAGRPMAYNDRQFDQYAPPEAKRRALENGQSFSAAVYPYNDTQRALGLAGHLGGSALGGGVGNVGSEYDMYTAGANVTSSAVAAAAAVANVANNPQAAAQMGLQQLYNQRALEEENNALRRRIDELKKQVADLMATNEFLLEQNAQLRNINKGPAGGQSLASSLGQSQPQSQLAPPNGPPISIAEMLPSAVSSLAASGHLPISSIAAALNTSVTSSASLVSYPILQSNPIMASAIPQSVSDRLIPPHSLSH